MDGGQADKLPHKVCPSSHERWSQCPLRVPRVEAAKGEQGMVRRFLPRRRWYDGRHRRELQPRRIESRRARASGQRARKNLVCRGRRARENQEKAWRRAGDRCGSGGGSRREKWSPPCRQIKCVRAAVSWTICDGKVLWRARILGKRPMLYLLNNNKILTD
jgi:hypothetical protein